MTHPYRSLAAYGTIGLEFVLSVVVGLFGGRWLDARFHTAPWLGIFGFLFGVLIGFRTLWKAAKRAEREAERENAKDPPPRLPPS